MRGEIIVWDETSRKGLIGGEDGRRYAFSGNVGRRTSRGMKVAFEPNGTAASSVRAMGVDKTAASRPDGSPWRLFVECVTTRYAGIRGRATRKEYWSFVMFAILIQFGMFAAGAMFDGLLGNLDQPAPWPALTIGLTAVAVLALTVPWICVSVRRLHDVGLSGWFYLFVPLGGAVPIIASFVGFAVFAVALWPSQKEDNEYGEASTSDGSGVTAYR